MKKLFNNDPINKVNTNILHKTFRSSSSILVGIAAAFVLGSIMLLIQGENPLSVYYYLIIEQFKSPSGIIKIFGRSTPLILTGLASAIAFKCNIFNIGVEGQLYVGALASAVVGISLTGISPIIHILFCILAGLVAGAAWAAVPALLKIKLKVHEVISTIMLNYIASNLISMLVVNYFRSEGPAARTPTLSDSLRLYQFFPPEHLNVGFIIAVTLCIAIYIVFQKTPFGWQIDAVGKNMEASRYSGINSNKIIMGVMLISGAVAGLCGVERVMGAYGYMELGFSPGYGFDGIAIAIIGRKHPIGVLCIALLIGMLQNGGVNINIMTNVPYEWVQAVIAFMFIFVAAGDGFYKNGWNSFKQKLSKKTVMR